MNTHYEVEHILDGLQHHLPVVDVDVELALNGVVHEDAGSEAVFVVFIVPVGLVCDGYTVPAVGVNMSEAFSTDTDNALGQNVGLLVEMEVVGSRVIESSDGGGHDHLVTHHGGHGVGLHQLPVEGKHRLEHFN